jgi:hypothetical protein
MSVVLRSLNGAKSIERRDDMALAYVTDEDVYLLRSREIYISYRSGMSVKKIARKYRLSVSYTYQLIREIPEDVKERVDGFGLTG